jgi:hypothetical protein
MEFAGTLIVALLSLLGVLIVQCKNAIDAQRSTQRRVPLERAPGARRA